jgi:flagellar secretion chaperone FliS
MRNPARTYREETVRGASPVGLVVILYQEVLRSILKAQQALQQGQIEQRTLELSHAVDVIGHLQSILDFKKGGDVALKLSRFYDVARAKILEANILSSKEILDWLSREFSEHIEAWQTVDRAVTSQEAEAESKAQAEAQAAPVRVIPTPTRPVRSNQNLPHPVRLRR